ncbi:hypothetical protein A3860_00500 [Niastella vici]|uniref:Oligosaccharide repeat unit polymerase n=2 Tax=Niastella vici TaxID=1703345 RepID=A0A1V9G8D7_9BACT|nr:hypothetical protein A3860_00500 [Niastella vici]
MYLFLCFATLFGMLAILWKYNRPGIIVFAFTLQWVQVVAYVIWMNVKEKPIDFLSKNAPNALLVACLGLLLMAFIISRGVSKLPVYSDQDFQKQASLVNKKKLLILYIISTLFLSSIGFVFGNTSGLAQMLVTVSLFKWIFFIWYGVIVWLSKKNRMVLIVILAYEFISGLYSYFSSFKEVLFYTIIVSLTFIKQITFRQFINFLLISVSLLFVFVTWTAVKGGYREFLNQGSRMQVVNVSKSEALSKIGEKVQTISWNQYQASMTMSLYRIQYILHLTKVMDRIPKIMPHENGKLWWENVSFVFTPRILFPEKSIYEPSKKTNKYTGFKYAGLQKGAAFSLGYFADSYVDFGFIGMFLPLSLLALFIVLIYRTFYNMHQLNLVFRFAIINVTLYNFISFEADGLFLFGRLCTNLLVFWILSKTVFPTIQKWLYE